ncbi:MAG TPA: hypothetical protein VFQ63_03250, partial [Patescibacteria group bacterium]|nr:hypothetical protein [Patescibacteria group bacterium]
MRKLLIGLVFLFSFFTIVAPSFADSNFSTTFDGTYSVKDNGLTHVVFQTTLVNTSDKYYATSYTLKLGFTDIQNVYASDPDGILTPALKTTPDGQEITFTFRHKAIGLGSKLPFTFSFDTTNVAVKNGSIWEVNIPGLADMNDFSDFSVHVVVPGDFGQPVYTKPDVGTGLTFTKTQLGKSGISIAFGNKQIYHMNLSYHLKNNQVFPVTTEIALPPTTNYQNVYIDN